MIADGVLIFILFVALATAVLFYFFVLRPLGLPFVPSRTKTVEEIMSLLGDVKGKKVLDLGSGDGKIVIAAARRGADATGFEINPFLVWFSRRKILRSGVGKNARILLADFWSTDVSAYDCIIFYGVVGVMPRLEEKLKNELKPEGRIVTSYCAFKNWKPTVATRALFLYEKANKEAVSKNNT